MTTYYTTPEKVSALLRLTDDDGMRIEFTTTSEPTKADVEMYINWAEDRIDKYTNNGWRSKTITGEWYSVPFPFSGIYPRWVAIPLRHMHIIDMSSIKVWWTNTVEDYKLTKTEGRNGDWYVDKLKGILWLRRFHPWFMDSNVLELSYTYGETSVPKDIEEACTKMAAITLLQNDFNKVVLADGLNYEPARSRVIETWNQDAEYILRRHMTYANIGTL